MTKANVKEKLNEKTNVAVERRMRNEVVGLVVSDKMLKTISVQVFTLVPHAKYGKYIRKSSVFKAHDEKGEAKVGDKVRIFECRPYSKTKRWTLAEIIERKKQIEGIEI